jgi:DNA-binding transcriptional MocR family regulator
VKCLVTVTNFQNPTGALMPDDNKKRLLQLARRHGLTIIEDDVLASCISAASTRPAQGLGP